MTSNETNKGRQQFLTRLPRDLHGWLKAEAAKQHRSLNAQLVHVVQQAKDGAA